MPAFFSLYGILFFMHHIFNTFLGVIPYFIN